MNELSEDDAEARELIEAFKMPEEKTPVERALLIHVEGFDWNCPLHSTSRYTEEEIARILEPMRLRFEALEAKNKRLRSSLPA